MPVQINEVIRRSKQGVTFPFLCRSENGQHYFAKGSGVGKFGLRAEWLGGCLARALGLPVPDFDQVIVPENIIQLDRGIYCRTDTPATKRPRPTACFWSQMPESWLDEGEDPDETSALELARISTILNRPINSPKPFWEGVL